MFTVPEALGDKIIHPFSDFLLHDIGTGDGIVQVGPQDTANKLRTAPLWGLRTKARFMHDLGSLSLDNAISRHDGEAREPARRFKELNPEERAALITFLNTLCLLRFEHYRGLTTGTLASASDLGSALRLECLARGLQSIAPVD